MRQTLRNGPISLALLDEHSFTRETIAIALQAACHLLEIVPFATVDEFLGSTPSYDLVLFHAHENIGNIWRPESKYLRLRDLPSIGPTVVLCDVESVESIKAAFDCGVRGYIPTINTTLEMAVEIIFLVKIGGTFVPASGLAPGKIGLSISDGTNAAPPFTPRQRAVLERLRMGKTNKIIAYELQMSSSSVKTHIRNIMRKMNATNRTEVACRAHELDRSPPLGPVGADQAEG
jgi:DNA-binding NarL/FixJ family response regulator